MHPEPDNRPDVRVAQLAATQWSVLSLAELRECGLSPTAVRHRVWRGWLHPVHRGVCGVGHPPLTLEARFLAAVKACGPRAVLSHYAGGCALGLRPLGRPPARGHRAGHVAAGSPRPGCTPDPGAAPARRDAPARPSGHLTRADARGSRGDRRASSAAPRGAGGAGVRPCDPAAAGRDAGADRPAARDSGIEGPPRGWSRAHPQRARGRRPRPDLKRRAGAPGCERAAATRRPYGGPRLPLARGAAGGGGRRCRVARPQACPRGRRRAPGAVGGARRTGLACA